MQRRRMLAILSGAAAVPLTSGLIGATAARAQSPSTPGRPPRSAVQLQQLLDAERDAGMIGVLAEVRKGAVSAQLASGVADLATGAAVTRGLQHRIGGVTKTFVAATVLQLAGEGKVNLDASVGAQFGLSGERAARVTPRMLLNQTSGIADYANVLLSSPESILATTTTRYNPLELIRIGLNLPPAGEPGQRWSYANTNYLLLGLMIERITGRSYADEITRRVLRPLKLADTYFPGTERRIRGKHMKAYIPWADGTLRDFSVTDTSWVGAAGDLISTVSDVNSFYAALLGGRLLRPDLLTQMMTTVPFDPAFADLGGYGLGLFWMANPCGRSWGHNGIMVGHTTFSAHSADGSSAQVTMAENYNMFAPPAHPQQPPHPIEAARSQFQAQVACGGASGTSAVAARLGASIGVPRAVTGAR